MDCVAKELIALMCLVCCKTPSSHSAMNAYMFNFTPSRKQLMPTFCFGASN